MEKVIEKISYETFKYDMAFLMLVTTKSKVLKNIIEIALNIKVDKIEIQNSKLYKEKLASKTNFLDLVVKVNDDFYVNIEVNLNSGINTIKRNTVFACSLVVNFVKKGMKVKEYPRVVQINLMYDDKANYERRNRTINERADVLEIIDINMDKVKEKYYNDNELTKNLLLVMLNMTREELENFEGTEEEEEMIREALKMLDEMNDDGIVPVFEPIGGSYEAERAWYVNDYLKWKSEEMAEEKAEKMAEEKLEKKIKEKIKEEKKSMVTNMLKENMDIALISKISGLTVNQINNITHSI